MKTAFCSREGGKRRSCQKEHQEALSNLMCRQKYIKDIATVYATNFLEESHISCCVWDAQKDYSGLIPLSLEKG